MPEETPAGSFAQPRAELALRERDGALVHLFTLRLTDTTLALVPSAEATAHLRAGLTRGTAGLETAPRFLRRVVGGLLALGWSGVETTFTPHPLAGTTITLAGPYLHVQIGQFDSEYGPGEFDPAAAAHFLQEYRAARGQ